MQHGSLAGYLLLNDNCDRLQYVRIFTRSMDVYITHSVQQCVDLVGAVEYLHEKQIVSTHGSLSG
jgi:hypothetical protein